MSNTVGTNIQQMKEELQELELQIERSEAVIACANLMNKYQYYHCRGMRPEETFVFALKTPGGSVEMLWGIYDGPDGILRWKFAEGFGKARHMAVGGGGLGHGMTTPIIEVAADAQTARGLWLFIGSEGPVWAAGQFAMDFIKEEGEWKIWRYNTTGLISSAFEKGWHVENNIPTRFGERTIDKAQGDMKPTRPPSYAWMWSPDEYFQNIPPVPLSYDTWDDSLACIPVPGRSWDIPKD